MYQDCGNYAPAEGGGANGCIQYEAEHAPGISARGDGLRAAWAGLQKLHSEVAAHVSLADLVYMAAAAALEQRGLAGLQMIYGRVDGGADACLAPEGLVPEFAGATHEPQEAAGVPAADGEGGDMATDDAQEEAEESKPPPPAAKVQLAHRLTRLGLTPAEQAALVGVYLSLHASSPDTPVDNSFLALAAAAAGGKEGGATPCGPAEAAAADGEGAEGGGAAVDGVAEASEAAEAAAIWREQGDMSACYALLEEPSVAPEVVHPHVCPRDCVCVWVCGWVGGIIASLPLHDVCLCVMVGMCACICVCT